MKLLVCASEYYPYGSGIANVAYNVVEQLKKMGVDCTVCSPTGSDIKLKTLKGYGRLSLIQYWHKVYKYFKRSENYYDVVWLHNPLFIGRNPFEKCLVTIHTTPHGQIVQRMYPWHIHIYKVIVSKIDQYCLNKLYCDRNRFVAISPQIINELKGLNINNVTLISNGTDTDRFTPVEDKRKIRAEFNIPNDAVIFLSVGRLTAMKMPFRMIDVFDKVQKASEKIMLVIAGRGEMFKSAKEYAMKKNVRNVKFLGFVPDGILSDLYAGSDYYIMSSKYEGLPLTLLEAMASGLPCIVSNIPNLRIVADANCGINIDFDDEEKAAQEIISYLTVDTSELSRNAREYAVNNLNWRIIARKYLEEFEKVYRNGEEQ